MEVPIARPLDLNLVTEICCYMGSLIDPIYKSNGSSALILNDIGEMSVTKSGMKILAEMHCHHPLAKLIINSVKNHHQATGDGTKTFMLLLKEIMAVLRKDTQREHSGAECRLKYIDEIFSLISELPELFTRLRSLPVVNEFLLGHRENPEFYFKQITLSFFSTKFPFAVAEQFSDLVCQFVCNEIAGSREISRMLQLLRNNFPILASKIESTTPPTVIGGFVFSKRLHLDFSLDSKEICFTVLDNVFEGGAVNKAVLKVESASEIHKLMHFHSKRYLNIVGNLKSSNISLVLTSGLATDEFKSICRRNTIFVFDGILQEEIEFLLWYTNMVPFDHWEQDVHVRHVGHAKQAEVIVLGSGRYLHLLFASCPQHIPLRHMVISATIKGLCNEYYDECWNCIKVLSHFITCESVTVSHNDQESSTKVNTIHGIACPFPTWCNQFCDILNSACVNASTFNLRLVSAIKCIIRNKFSDLSTDGKPVSYLEPVACYESLVYNVLSLSTQLLKIDKIINVQKSILSPKWEK